MRCVEINLRRMKAEEAEAGPTEHAPSRETTSYTRLIHMRHMYMLHVHAHVHVHVHAHVHVVVHVRHYC